MAKKNHKFGISQVIFLILTIALMCLIFYFSSENADMSNQSSGRITRIVVELFHRNYYNEPPDVQQEIWDRTTFIVRKLAHFSIYATLGFCASFTAGRKKLFSLKSLGIIVFGFLYAFSDEMHQKFSAGRSCEFRDIMIDTCGVTTGLLVSLVIMGIIAFIVRKRRGVSGE